MASPLADILMRAQAPEGEGGGLPDWLLSAMRAAPARAEFPYHPGDFSRSAGMRPVGIGETLGNIYEGIQNRDERGVPQGPGFGAALTVAPGAGQVISAAPKVALAGLAGYNLLSGTDPAGSADDPQAVKELQIKLRDAGLYRGEIDGKMGPGTQRAQQEFTASENARVERENADRQLRLQEGGVAAQREKAIADKATADAAAEETRRKGEADAATLARKQAGDERMRDIEKNISPTSRIIRDYSGPIGLAGGAVLSGFVRGGMKSVADAISKSRAAAGDAIMASPTVGNKAADIALSRVARVNDFFRKGGGEVPFINTPSASPGFAVNPKAVPLSSLYNPSKLNHVADVTAVGLPAGESLYADHKASEAADELIKAQEAAAVDPSEVNIQRIQSAKDNVALYTGASNLGRVAAGSIAAGRVIKPNAKITPTMAPAENEQLSLQKLLRENYERAEKKAALAAAKSQPRVPAPQVGVPPAMTGPAATRARTLHSL